MKPHKLISFEYLDALLLFKFTLIILNNVF